LTGREERIKELLSASDGAAFEIKENVTVFKPIRR